ncbi:MAG: ThiF family adenylyltransferase [Victivallales bacterium]|nr:ThiF family adenylyltransferase [Victivallales bacterium]
MNFNRIMSTIDVETMQQSNVTLIGGAYGLARGLVHSGLGSVTLVDFDRIDATNPARQDFYSTDIGRFKVEATAEMLRKINPQVHVEYYMHDYCALSRQEHDSLFAHTDLFVFATDFFPAQARGNIEALRLGIPAIWVGIYKSGKAGEIVFHIPGKTEACYRCICGKRYQAFQRGRATVSSDGGTIFDLHLIDAIVGQIAVGILTDGAENRMGTLINKLGNRNFMQVKIDPDYRLGNKDIFGQYLGDHPANFSFTTIALPVERDEYCPDCSGYQAGND